MPGNCPYFDEESRACKLGPTNIVIDPVTGEKLFDGACDDPTSFEECENYNAAEGDDDELGEE